MKRLQVLSVLCVVSCAFFSGCSSTKYDNGVKIEKSGWFGHVQQEVNTDSQGS